MRLPPAIASWMLQMVLVAAAWGSAASAQTVDVQLIFPSAAQMPASIAEWEANPSVAQLLMTNTGGDDLFDLRLDATLTGTRRGQIARADLNNPSHPRFDLGFGETRSFLWDEVVSSNSLIVASGLSLDLIRDGIPEDTYRLCVRVVGPTGNDETLGGERCISITIFEPDPPALISPQADATIDPATLQFTWTPIVLATGGVLTYRLVLKPRFVGQDAQTAMTANPTLLDTEVPVTSYLYLPSDDPLDTYAGTEGYVWQVQSLRDGDPVGRNDGLSRIGTFVVPVEEDPVADAPLVWRFPVTNPLITSDLEGMEVLPLDGSFAAAGLTDGQVGPVSMTMAFNGNEYVLIDMATGSVGEDSGDISLRGSFALEARIDEAGQPQDWQAAAAGSAVGGSGRIVFDIGRDPRVTSDGLVNGGPSGNQLDTSIRGEINVDGLQGSYPVVFSSDFALGGEPFRVVRGRVDFIENGRPVAWLDADGFQTEGVVTSPVVDGLAWRFPAATPLITVPLEVSTITTQTTPNGLVADGYTPDAQVGALSMIAAFVPDMDAGLDGAELDVEAGTVLSGFVRLVDPFALEARIDAGGQPTDWRTRPPGSTLDAPGHIVFDIGNDPRVAPVGLTNQGPNGNQTDSNIRGEVNVGTLQGSYPIVFSPDFALGGEPLRVVSGRVAFVDDDRAIAWLDAGGFQLEGSATPPPEPVAVNSWLFPRVSPLLRATFEDAVAEEGGFSVPMGEAQASLPDETIVRLRVEDASFDGATGALASGTVTLDDDFALYLGVDGRGVLQNVLHQPASTPRDAPPSFLGLVLTVPDGAVVTPAGLQLTADTPAELNIPAEQATGCSLRPEATGLTLGPGAVGALTVTGGAATVVCAGRLVARIDPLGIFPVSEEEPLAETTLVAWRFPTFGTAVTLDVETPVPPPATIRLSGESRAVVGADTMDVSLMGATLNLEAGTVESGSVVFERSFAIAASVGEILYGWTPVPEGRSAGQFGGLVFDIGRNPRITPDGLVNSGPYEGEATTPDVRGELRYGSLPRGPYRVLFSRDFAMGGRPFRPIRGRVYFYLGDQQVAYLEGEELIVVNPDPVVDEAARDTLFWAFPTADPLLRFAFAEYEETEQGRTRVLDDRAVVTDPEGRTTATPISTILELSPPSVYANGGKVVLRRGFYIESPLDQDDRFTAWRGVASDQPFDLQRGVRLYLAPSLFIDGDGLKPGSSRDVQIAHERMPAQGMEAYVSDDFRFGLDPFVIRAGRIEFRRDSILLAVATPQGFSIQGDIDPVVAGMPERLPLPAGDVAYLPLRNGSDAFVDATPQNDGTLLLTARAGVTPELVFPMLPDSPRIAATLRGLRVDAETYAVVGGTVEASVPTGDARFGPEVFGVPIQTTDFAAGVFDGEAGLQVRGPLVLFGRPLTAAPSVAALIGVDATLRATVEVAGLRESFPLVANSDRASLDVRGISGTLTASPAQGTPAVTTFTLDAAFALNDAGTVVASADLALDYQGDAAIRVARFTPGSTSGSATSGLIDLGGPALGVNALTALRTFAYDPATGFDFAASLDLDLAVTLDGTALRIPLDGAELRHTGFDIPTQDATFADADRQPFGPIALRLLYVHLDRVAFDWFAWQPGQPVPFDPTLQLEVSLPGFDETGLADVSATVNEARLVNGQLTGTLVPYEAPGFGARVPFSGTTSLLVREVKGELSGSGRAVSIAMTGVVDLRSQYATDPAPGCSEPRAALTLTGAGAFEGAAEAFVPCGALRPEALPLTLAFENDSQLDIAYGPTERRLSAAGTATASLTGGEFAGTDGNAATARGPVRVNLATGAVEEADLALGAFGWTYPRGEPLFTFQVPGGRITPSGLTLDGNGTLARPGGATETVPARFAGLTVAFDTEQITAGSVALDDGFSFEIGTAPLAWSLTGRQALAATDTDVVLLTMPSGLTLNRDGLAASETSTGAVHAGNLVRDGLAVAFQDSFRMTFGPTVVAAGRAEWNDGSETIATLDRAGLRITGVGLAAATIPATLPLPSEATAFLRLAEAAGTPVVQVSEPDGDGLRLLTTLPGQTATLVLAGLVGPGESAPSVAVTLDADAGVRVDDAFAIRAGAFEVTPDTPLNLLSTGTPMRLGRLRYAEFDGAYGLRAASSLALPASIAGLGVDLGTDLPFAFTEGGLTVADGATFTLGAFATEHTDSAADETALAEVMLQDGAFEMAARGVQIVFGADPVFKLSGDLTSTLFGGGEGEAQGLLHYVATFGGGGWTFELSAAHLSERALPLGEKATLTLPEGNLLRLDATDQVAAFTLTGPTLSIPEAFGDGFDLTVDSLRVGTDGVFIDADAVFDQTFVLFGDFLTINTSRVGVEYGSDTNVFYVEVDGTMETKLQEKLADQCAAQAQPGGCPSGLGDGTETYAFEDMRLGTDGSFSIGAGEANLLTNPIAVIEDRFWFDEMRIAFEADTLLLTMGGTVVAPLPAKDGTPDAASLESSVRVTIDSQGRQSVAELTFAFEDAAVPTINGSPAEVEMGDDAVFELTGMAYDIDLDDPRNIAFYYAGGLHIRSQEEGAGGQRASSRDASGRARYIAFGDHTAIRENPGLMVSTAEGLAVSVSLEGTNQDPLFEFVAGKFSIALTSVAVATQLSQPGADRLDWGFQVTLGGNASLVLDGIEGTLNYEGLVIDQTGIVEWGGPAGGFSLAVDGIMSLAVGCFEYKPRSDAPYQLTTSVRQPGEGEQTETSTLSVNDYLRFGGACGGGDTPALEVTLDAGGFSGSVDEILYYTDTGGGVVFSIQGVSIAMAGTDDDPLASLYANFRLETDGAGGVAVDVLGVGSIANISLGATGKLSTLNGQLSFGIFLAASGLSIDLFPIIPRTVMLTGAGGGFFYRPTNQDIGNVYTLLDNLVDGGFDANNPNGLPDASGLQFAVMIYAGIGLVGQPPNAIVDANGLITITDQFFNIDLNGQLLRQGESLQAGAYLTVDWTQPEALTVSGGFKVDVDYASVLTGSMRIDFAFAPQAWSIHGSANLSVVSLLDFTGEFLVGPPGFVAILDLSVGEDLGVISFEGNFHAEFWYVTENGDFGAYASLSVSASFLSFASVSAELKGALIRTQLYGDVYNNLVYATARADVSLNFGLFEVGFGGQIWVSVLNGAWDGGLGEEEKYSGMVEEARASAQAAVRQAREGKAAAEAAKARMEALQERLRAEAQAEYDRETLAAIVAEETPLYQNIGARVYVYGAQAPAYRAYMLNDPTMGSSYGPATFWNYFVQWSNADVRADPLSGARFSNGAVAYQWSGRQVPDYAGEFIRNVYGGTYPVSFANQINTLPGRQRRLNELNAALSEAKAELDASVERLTALESLALDYRDQAEVIYSDIVAARLGSPLPNVVADDGTIAEDVAQNGGFTFVATTAEAQEQAMRDSQAEQDPRLWMDRYATALREVAAMHEEVRLELHESQTRSFARALDALNDYYTDRLTELGGLQSEADNARRRLSWGLTTSRTNTARANNGGWLNRLIDQDIANAKAASVASQYGYGRDERGRMEMVIEFYRAYLQAYAQGAEKSIIAENTADITDQRNDPNDPFIQNLEPTFRATAQALFSTIHRAGLDSTVLAYQQLVAEGSVNLRGHQDGLIQDYQTYTTTIDSLYAIQVDLAQYTYGLAELYKDWLTENQPAGIGLLQPGESRVMGGSETTLDGQIYGLVRAELPRGSYYRTGHERYIEELAAPTGYGIDIFQTNLQSVSAYRVSVGASNAADAYPYGFIDRYGRTTGWKVINATSLFANSPLVNLGPNSAFYAVPYLVADAEPFDIFQSPPEVCAAVRLRGVGGVSGPVESACKQLDSNVFFLDAE
ncbi:MAG: hypothetical protein AAF624_04980 [Bacteroidota bacterium]